MVSSERWEAAQSYETQYWRDVAREVAEGETGRIDFYSWRTDQLREWLESVGRADVAAGTSRILEVGGGPVGILPFLPGSRRMSVDPLADVYAEDDALASLRSPDIEYRAAPGESIPADDGSFDLVLIENCIDHVKDMHAVLAELNRVMVEGGMLYLTVNARCLPGYYVHRALSRLKLDPGHPHTMTRHRPLRLVEGAGFQVLGHTAGSFWKEWVSDLRGPGLRPRAKAVLGVSEYLVSLLAEKRSA